MSLMMIARAGDNLMGAYPFSVYATQGYNGDPGYYGIRRAPYSANHAINDLSFRHMANGEPTPTNHPFQVLGNNAEVHNAGEVWAAMMWEGYVALQQAETAYQSVLDRFADQSQAVTAAHFGLAAIAENRGKWDAAKQHYDAILNGDAIDGYKEVARRRERALAQLQTGNWVAIAESPTSSPTTQAAR